MITGRLVDHLELLDDFSWSCLDVALLCLYYTDTVKLPTSENRCNLELIEYL